MNLSAPNQRSKPSATKALSNLDAPEFANDRQFVTALARGLEILRCFKAGEKYLSNATLAQRTGLPRPTITRLTYTLIKLGYLDFSEQTGLYCLGSSVLGLGYALLSNIDVRNLARQSMQELAQYTNASVSIGLRDRLSMVYIETCRTSTNVTLRLDVGSRIPIATTAMGKAWLCGASTQERDYIESHIRLNEPQNWTQIKANLDRAYQDYAEQGFCSTFQTWDNNISAVGVPLVDVDSNKMMALNCGGPSFLFSKEVLINDIGPRLVNLVKELEVKMGRS